MSALDNISELATYKVPVKFTVEYETEIKMTGTNWDEITDRIDEYINEYFDDMASDAIITTGKSQLKNWEEKF